jgi:plastocyanin
MNGISRRRALAMSGTALATMAAGCSGDGGSDDGDDGGDEETVGMTDDLAFEPDDLAIASGTTVTWENEGSVGHTVTAYEQKIPADAEYFASGDFDSESAARDDIQAGTLGEGESYSHTFETTGEYEYFCIPHENAGMVGSITVE